MQLVRVAYAAQNEAQRTQLIAHSFAAWQIRSAWVKSGTWLEYTDELGLSTAPKNKLISADEALAIAERVRLLDQGSRG